MKIAIIGYGKTGHAIERVALERGHETVRRIDAGNTADLGSELLRSADVAIEFTTPSTARANIEASVAAGVPVVCGTTGWLDALPEVARTVEQAGSALLASSNFSVGVYITRLANSYLASMMGRIDGYRPRLAETHHIHKLDYPSGTAITIANDIVEQCRTIECWKGVGKVDAGTPGAPAQELTVERNIAALPAGTLPVTAIRRGEVPGIHTVTWESDADSITLTHSAKSRDGFALGAVMAAEWLKGRRGVYTIDDMMTQILDL